MKYNLDHNIFENIDCEEKAYWLGFLLADGSIQIRKSGQAIVKLSLASVDKEHIQKFLNFLKCDMPIKTYLVGNGFNNNKSKSCEVSITSKKIVEDLGKLGIGPRKSFTVSVPKIREDLISHLIRGIWDGDGSVFYGVKNKKYINNLSPTVQICGNKLVLDYINELFYKELNLKQSKLTKTSSIFLFRKDTRSAQKVINYLYKNCSIYLNRKYEKALLGMSWEAKKKPNKMGDLRASI